MTCMQQAIAQQPREKVEPLPMANVSELEVKLQSLLPPGAGFNLDLGEARLQGQVVPAPKLGSLPYTPACTLALTVNQLPLSLEVDHGLLDTLLHGMAPSLPFDALPRKLGLALLQSALAPLIDRVTAGKDLQVHLVDVQTTAQAIPEGARLVWKCLYGKAYCWAAIILPPDTLGPDTLGVIEALCPDGVTRPPPGQLQTDELPLGVSVVLTGTTLSRRELNDLEWHDVILLEQYAATDAPYTFPAVQLRAGETTLCRGTLQTSEQGIELHITHNRKESPMNQPDQALTEESIEDLDDLPMEVTFEVARHTLTIAQLRSLRSRQVFALDTPAQSPVTVLVNGKAVAEAELVLISDRVGVRITRVLLPASN